MPILTQQQIEDLMMELKSDTKVKGVLLTGSYAYGKPNEDSDIEIVCITNDSSDAFDPDRMYHGVSTEIFYNSLEKIRNTHWKKAIEEGHGDCVHFWAYGKIVYDKDGTVQKLQEEARKLWLKGPPDKQAWTWRWEKHGGGYPKAPWEFE